MTFEPFGTEAALDTVDLSYGYSHGKSLFKSIDFKLTSSDSLAITGRNGSGKTTLLKLLAGLFSPNSGKISFTQGGKIIPKSEFPLSVGYVAPYLALYDEFTAPELIGIVSKLRNLRINENKMRQLLGDFGLNPKKNLPISGYSSGMQQRLKYALALLHKPQILLLDEPFTNLDSDGIERIKRMADNFLAAGGILVIATNDENEKALCSSELHLKGITSPQKPLPA
jgi:heme exporter protein A